jgi:chromosome segregation ATPase
MEVEHQTTLNEMKALQNQMDDKEEQAKRMKEERELIEEEMHSLKEFLASKKSEQEREAKAREKLEHVLRQASDASERKEEEVKLKIIEAKGLKEQLIKSETQLQNEKFRADKIEKEKDIYFSKVSRLQQEVDDRSLDLQKLANQNHEHKRLLESRDDELARIKDVLKQTTRIKDSILKKQKALDEVRMQTEMERDALRVTVYLS